MKRKIGKEPAEYRREQDRKMAQVAHVWRKWRKCGVIEWEGVKNERVKELKNRMHMNQKNIKALLKSALTDQIDDREIFMKGIDYSYYYEQQD